MFLTLSFIIAALSATQFIAMAIKDTIGARRMDHFSAALLVIVVVTDIIWPASGNITPPPAATLPLTIVGSAVLYGYGGAGLLRWSLGLWRMFTASDTGAR